MAISCCWSLMGVKYINYNEHNGVLNHQPHDCLSICLISLRSKKTSKLRVTGLWEGNSPVTGASPTQRAGNAEYISIWWRHHVPITHPYPSFHGDLVKTSMSYGIYEWWYSIHIYVVRNCCMLSTNDRNYVIDSYRQRYSFSSSTLRFPSRQWPTFERISMHFFTMLVVTVTDYQVSNVFSLDGFISCPCFRICFLLF